MSNLAEKLIGAIDRAISGEPREYALRDTMAAVGREIGPVLSAGELAEARDCQRDWQRCLDAVAAHYDTEAKKAWLAHGATVTTRMIGGEFPAHEHCWTREQWESDFAARRDHAKAGMHEASARSLPILKKAGERFAKATRKLSADLEAVERTAAAKFCVAYGPSTTVLRLRQCVEYATHIPSDSPTLRTAPKDMAPFLGI